MRKPGFYRLLSLVLVPVGALFGMIALIMLLAAMSNPQVLIVLFVVACVVIYIFSSLAFLNRGIIRAQPCRQSLKELIKVNAIVTGLFSIMMLLQMAVVLANPSLAAKAVVEAMETQPDAAKMPPDALMRMVKGMIYFLGVIALLLLVHIIQTFRLLKQYRHVFQSSGSNEQS